MTFSVAAAVDAHVDALEEPREPDGMWHPSGLFGCERKAVYDFLATPKEPNDARTKRVFRLGHIFHEFVQTAVHAAGGAAAVYDEVKIIHPDWGTKGHCDILVQLLSGTWVVIEIKSIKSTGMKYSDLPKDDHRKQVGTYVAGLRKYGGVWREGTPEEVRIPPLGDLVDVLFVYMSKDDLEIREFWQVHTPEKEAWIDQYLAKLRAHVAGGTLPRRLVRLTPTGNVSKQRDYRCGYCPFASRCWDQDPEGVDL